MNQCLTESDPLEKRTCQLSDTQLGAGRDVKFRVNPSLINFFSTLVLTLLTINVATASDDFFPFKSCFEASGKKYELDASFLAGVASVESGFNPLAKSSSGALGLMQIKWPQTAKELGITKKADLFDPCRNIDAGAQYLANLQARFGSKLFAIAAYFQGPTKIEELNNIPAKSVSYIERVLREENLILSSNELKRDGKCGLIAFQTLTQNTHHPKKKREVAHRWIVEHHQFCSTPDLLKIKNRLPELMGTADPNGILRLLINNTIQRK
jgi:hypothetical protein